MHWVPSANPKVGFGGMGRPVASAEKIENSYFVLIASAPWMRGRARLTGNGRSRHRVRRCHVDL